MITGSFRESVSAIEPGINIKELDAPDEVPYNPGTRWPTVYGIITG